MGNLEEEIGRQRQSELAEANSDIQREASINPALRTCGGCEGLARVS